MVIEDTQECRELVATSIVNIANELLVMFIIQQIPKEIIQGVCQLLLEQATSHEKREKGKVLEASERIAGDMIKKYLERKAAQEAAKTATQA